jgi:hypothetical protein
MADGLEVLSEITSTTLVSHIHCVKLHCHTEGSHLITDHLFGLLKQQFRGLQFHNNQEVEMAIYERLQIQEYYSAVTEFLNLYQGGTDVEK